MRCLLAVLFLFVLSKTIAQDFQVSTYHLADGLPSNVTKSIIQDKDGFIWIATDKGISRFDGKTFLNISENLPSSYVKSIFINKKQDLMLAVTDNGLVEVINYPDTVITKKFGEPMHLAKNIYEDCKGRLWITEDTAIVRYENQKFKRYRIDRAFWNINTQNYWRSFIFWEDSCQLGVASPSGLFLYYDEKNEAFEYLPMENPKGFFGGQTTLRQINHVLQLKDSKILVAANGHDCIVEMRVDWQSKKIYAEKIFLEGKAPMFFLETPEKEIYLATLTDGLLKLNSDNYNNYQKYDELFFKVCNHLFMDREENIWVNGDAGIAVLKPKFFRKISVPSINYISKDRTVYGIANDSLYKVVMENNQAKEVFLYKNSALKELPRNAYIINQKVYWIDQKGMAVWVSKEGTKRKPVFYSHIFISHVDRQDNIWAVSYRGEKKLFKISLDTTIVYTLEQPAYSVYEDSQQNIWLGTYGSKQNYLYKLQDKTFINQSFPNPVDTVGYSYRFGVPLLLRDDKHIWIGSDGFGLWLHEQDRKKFSQIDLTPEFNNQPITALVLDKQNKGMWIGFNIALMYYREGELFVFNERYGLPTTNIFAGQMILDEHKRLWAITSGGLAITRKPISSIPKTPKPIFLAQEINKIKDNNAQEIPYQSFLKIRFAALSYPAERVAYQYRVTHKGKTFAWQNCDQKGQLDLAALDAGYYLVEIRAKQQGIYTWSEALVVEFFVQNAWYKTWWGVSLVILVFATTIFLAIALYGHRLRQQKRNLEMLVEQRTRQIQNQTQEIAAQRDALQEQQNEILKKKHDIESSIRYASRIQNAVMPRQDRMSQEIPEHFVFFRPRDIVSGDFYWFEKIDNKILVSAADCTGHGVPGAFMSLLASSALNMIIFQKQSYQPAQILNELDISIKTMLKQESSDNQDGVDMAICLVDLDQQKLFFAGAKNPMLLFQQDQNQTYHTFVKGSKKPIGGQYYQNIGFEEHSFDLLAKNTFYLYSDGFQDQFGGAEGKKFLSRNFKNLLLQNAELDMESQKKVLMDTFEQWIGTEHTPTDDVLVLGFRIKT